MMHKTHKFVPGLGLRPIKKPEIPPGSMGICQGCYEHVVDRDCWCDARSVPLFASSLKKAATVFLACIFCLGCAVPREQRFSAHPAAARALVPAPTAPPIETIAAGDIRIDIIWRQENGRCFVAIHVPQGYSSDHRYKTLWDTEFLLVSEYQLQTLREWGERR